MKPHIDRTNLNPVVIKVNHTLSLDIKVTGEPAPVVTWVFKEKELKTEDQYRIDNIDYNTKFCILKTKRVHSGVYKITAKNEVGEDTAELEVTVLGELGAPVGVRID